MTAETVSTSLVRDRRIQSVQREIGSSTLAPLGGPSGELLVPFHGPVEESLHQKKMFWFSKVCGVSNVSTSTPIAIGSYASQSKVGSAVSRDEAWPKGYFTVDKVASHGTGDIHAYLMGPRCEVFLGEGLWVEPLLHQYRRAHITLLASYATTESDPGKRQRTQIAVEMERVFRAARDDEFEHGVESRLEAALAALVVDHGDDLVSVLQTRLSAPMTRLSREVHREVLLSLGRISDLRTQGRRVALLESQLQNPVPSIRDAAALALLELEDLRTREILERAKELETHPQVKANLELALATMS